MHNETVFSKLVKKLIREEVRRQTNELYNGAMVREKGYMGGANNPIWVQQKGDLKAEVSRIWDDTNEVHKYIVAINDVAHGMRDPLFKKMENTLENAKKVVFDFFNKSSIRESSMEETIMSEKESLYKKFFDATLKAFAQQKGLGNITSPQELPPELKKEFYTYIDSEWKRYKEQNGEGGEGDQPPMDTNAPAQSGEMPSLTPPDQIAVPNKMS